jgi:hypothetical protein
MFDPLSMGILAGANVVGSIGTSILGGGKAKFNGLDPRTMKGELMISGPRARAMAARGVQDINQQNASDRLAISRSNAPVGARLSMLGNVAGRGAKAASGISGDVERIKADSAARYVSMVNDYEAKRHAVDQYNAQSDANLFGSAVGGLGAIGAMWASGMFGGMLGNVAGTATGAGTAGTGAATGVGAINRTPVELAPRRVWSS